jgi:hypothetical protein
MTLVKISITTVFLGIATSLLAAPLITPKEAELPDVPPALSTRGISRGPAIKLNSPEANAPVASPFEFKVSFDARGESKIDPSSVKVIYMKSPFVDLTPRLKPAISASGIDFSKAEVPPGNHAIRITVKDTEGRETNAVMNLVVTK